MDILRGLVNVARMPVYQERQEIDEEEVAGVGVEEIPEILCERNRQYGSRTVKAKFNADMITITPIKRHTT